MKRRVTVFLFYLSGICFLPFAGVSARQENPPVLGAERMDMILPLLKDKQVGLVVNRTSILESTHTHLLDTLLAEKIAVKKIFAPEHGFRGTAGAGEEVKNSVDAKTGIPVVSIYGKEKKPTAGQLSGLDVVVFDIQDVGARFYTYISTMHYVMEACAENGKECVVLDRPNPNDFVDGPIRRKGLESFVGLDPVPLLHGLTVGELAFMINGEGWLKNLPAGSCRLTVVPMKNWRHGDRYDLPVKPSPNLPNSQAVRLYPSLCLFEATPMSIGRGVRFPFQVIGYPDRTFGTFSFTPVSLPGFDTNPVQKDNVCFGVDLREYPFEGGFTLRFLLDFYEKSGRDTAFFFSRPHWFDRLAGTKELRRQIIQGMKEDEIRATWQQELDAYKTVRKKYLLYPDYL
ncbi:MAG: DUF1343 domain-containing protein [Tannerellaceae bacterium]|jgi:uncharacterized protein YbbC (DUF1343 family)|nr:DUF1343 domain-containing protein [Tannerellaceae bacterium]